MVTRLPAEQLLSRSNRELGLSRKGRKPHHICGKKLEDRQTHMSQKSIDAVFAGLYAFTDIRSLLRKSAPLHALAPEEKEQILTAVTTIRTAAADIERDLI